jgi:UDP-glucose 4-epimerase
MRRWIVTGGCGFIGRNLISRLLKESDSLIRVVDDLSICSREELGALFPLSERSAVAVPHWRADQRLALIVGDICDQELAMRVTVDADVIIQPRLATHDAIV